VITQVPKDKLKAWIDDLNKDIKAWKAARKKYTYKSPLEVYDCTVLSCGESTYVDGGLDQAIEGATALRAALKKEYAKVSS